MKLKIVFCVSLVLLMASIAMAQDLCGPPAPRPLFANWPQYQFGANHNGCNPYEFILNPSNVGNLIVKWTQSTSDSGYNSSIVADGVLYTSYIYADVYGYIVALDASTGAGIWQYYEEHPLLALACRWWPWAWST